MRIVLVVLLLGLNLSLFANNPPKKGKKSAWVNTIMPQENENKEPEGGFHYLLTDYQVHIPKQEEFKHYVVRLLNSEGVQGLSDLSMDYDPSYQKLTIHKIRIIRGDKRIDKLVTAKIQTIQRESNSERNMYDGSVSAMVHLTDVRVDDVLEYSFTVTNFNPINNGNFSDLFYQEYYLSIDRMYDRIVTDNSHPIKYQLKNGALKPERIVNGNIKTYVWDIKDVSGKNLDNNTPIWYDDNKHVLLSTFKNWTDVVDWVVPLYQPESISIEEFDDQFKEVRNKHDRITGIIDWVQDEIRYLGFESGIGAYRPNSPRKVAEQRYGDCKDKSLLLVSLLKEEGVEAYPLLVNSYQQIHIAGTLPSNGVFNHCVVQFNVDGENYFVDPTYSGQGGDYSTKQFPYYGRGLRIKAGETTLMKIPRNGKSKMKVKEVFTVAKKGEGSSKLWVRSSYYGNKADVIRNYFQTSSQESIKTEYLNFYSSIYPDIQSVEDVRIIDNSKSTTNEVFVEEYYEIANFWKDDETENYSYTTFEPLLLSNLLSYPSSANRTMPYALGEPFSFSQTTEIVLPEEWLIYPSSDVIAGDGFVYSNKIEVDENRVFITNSYDLIKTYIDGDSVSNFLEKHEQINAGIAYRVTYNPNQESFKFSWIAIFIALLGVSIGVFVLRKIHREFNPVPENEGEGKAIGGWLILSGFGISITPLVFLKGMILPEHFNKYVWDGLFDSSIENPLEMVALFGGEIFYNFLFLTFLIFLVIQFYQRRSSFPKLILVYYGLALIVPILDAFFLSRIMPESIEFMDEELLTATIGVFVMGLVWGLYYTLSVRVKETFVKRFNG